MNYAISFITAMRVVIGVMEAVLITRVFCEFKVVRRDTAPFQFLLQVSEPLLNPVRRILLKQSKENKLKFDISPFVVLIILYLLDTLLKNFLR
ncbi:MAG TPA: hypothetical protein DD738_01505 [Ruminiclostridium sp.]|jgi:uncharacterized protein YggT (Ycf19 family)|nr:hypothetical protein [Ruminiclostridium sp.]